VKELTIIYSGQTPEEVAENIAKKHNLAQEAKAEIIVELEKQLKNLEHKEMLNK